MNTSGSPAFPDVAVLGPGLLGGSLAMAIRRSLPHVRVRLWARREAPLEYARSHQLADFCSTNLLDVVSGAALVILATPTTTYLTLAEQFVDVLAPETLVTDVGSTKGDVHAGVGRFLLSKGHLFLGSHPMAGSEKQGIEYARADLFHDATVVITDEHPVAPHVVQHLTNFWTQLGARTITLPPLLHDRLVAAISHTPHILSALIARAATSNPDLSPVSLRQLASTGYRDTTRICSGSPTLWTDILSQNADAICPLLEFCIRDLQDVLRLLQNGQRDSLQQWLSQAQSSVLPPSSPLPTHPTR